MNNTMIDYRQQAVKLFEEREVVDVYGQIERLEKEQASSLTMEKNSAPELARRLAELQMYTFLGVTEHLPLEPLSWRNEEGEPLFGLLTPLGEGNIFRIVLEVDDGSTRFLVGAAEDRWSGTIGLPNAIASMYSDMREHLNKRRPRFLLWRKDARVSMQTQYNGLIPGEVRSKIKTASSSGLFEKILMIFEAPEWSYQQLPVPQYRDPMIIGWAHGRAYLITSFMPTTVEQLWLDTSQPTGND